MPPRAQSPRPASTVPPSAPPLFSARPFLLGAAVALLLSQAALLARLHPPAAPLLRAAGAGGSAGDVSSPGNSATPAILTLIPPLPSSHPSPPFSSTFTNPSPPLPSPCMRADTPAPAATCAIPQQKDRDSRVHAAMARSIEALAIALACSHPASHAPHAPNASQSAHPSPAPDPSLAALSLPRSFRHTHCSAATALLPTPLPMTPHKPAAAAALLHKAASLTPLTPLTAGSSASRPPPVILLHVAPSLALPPPAHVAASHWPQHSSLPAQLLAGQAGRRMGGTGGGVGGGGVAGGGGGATRAIELGVEGRVAVGLGQSSQNSEGSQGNHGRQAVHGRRSGASRGSGWWGAMWNSRASAGKGTKSREGRGVGDGRGREGEGRQWKYFLSAMAFNRAAAAAPSAGSGTERCQAALFAIFQWMEYMRYAGTEHVFWYDCAASDAESQAAALSVYVRAGLLTYHRLHQIAPPPAGANYHFDQDSSLSHFLQHHRHESKWVAFADVDEYIFMPPDTHPGFLTRLLLRRPCAAQHPAPGGAGGTGRGREEEEGGEGKQHEATQVLLYNQFFIGYLRPAPARLTIERFIHRPHRPPDHHDRLRGKLLLQPAAALGFLSHAPHRAIMHSGETIVADTGFIRVNHYWGDRGLSGNASEREREEVEDGSVDDRSMQVVADVIKRRLKWVVPVLPVLCEREAVVGAMMEAQRLADVLLQAVQMENG
ncbi:unnamed protein product [Closterium sp. Naga37s-1]|nr:unnamed protein product [Closterium sp. Naga37s-1]